MSDTPASTPAASMHEKVDERDLYQVLQVDPMASREIIAEAYWVLVRKTQALRTQDQTAGEVLQQLNVAYATLANPDLRLRYSRTLPLDRQQTPNSVPEDGQHKRRPLRQRFLGRRHLPGGGRRNAYQILQVDPRAEPPIIAAAYAWLRQQCMEGIWNGEAGQEALNELTEAFSVLADPEQRASYDANFPGLRWEEEPAPEPSLPTVADEAGTAPTESAVNVTIASKAWAGTAKLASAVDWSGISRRLFRFLGRLLVWAGLGACYIGGHLYRGMRWLAVAAVAPAARGLVAAAASSVDTLLERLEARPTAATPGDMDQAVKGRLCADSVPSIQALSSARPPLASVHPGTPIARLVIRGGPHAGSTFMVTDRPISLGADPQCDVILKAQGDGVAPFHARIWCREGRFMIHQIADCQKIIVSGQPLVWGILEDGDELRIGDHRLTFELTAPSCGSIWSPAGDRSGDNKP
jgi:curved DNA-binding protein CbpA